MASWKARKIYQINKRVDRRRPNTILIKKIVLKNCERRKTNLAVTWIGYKRHTRWFHGWISEFLKMFGIAKNIETFISDRMQ